MKSNIEIRIVDLLRPENKIDEKPAKERRFHKTTDNTTECIICFELITREDKIWNCSKCRKLYHLRCMRKWVETCSYKVLNKWACPNCQAEYNNYRLLDNYCYCGKVRNPKFMGEMDPENPHRCNNICGRTEHGNRGNFCKHPCVSICHKGFCPPCNSSATITCPCGKIPIPITCNQRDNLNLVSTPCGNPCEKTLNCGIHKCSLNCHQNKCPPCKMPATIICECGKETRSAICGDIKNLGFFVCKNTCGKLLDCGFHNCTATCHSGNCGHCSTSPYLVTHCFCGKSPLSGLIPQPRVSCKDPIPSCEKVCGKYLKCRNSNRKNSIPHFCMQKCHKGPCPPCTQTTIIKCNCGKEREIRRCRDVSDFNITKTCARRCNQLLNCRRHRCKFLCCDSSTHKRLRCQEKCTQIKKCKIHPCRLFCHADDCGECTEVVNEPVFCGCGSIKVNPPFVCGMSFPKCSNSCPIRCPKGHRDGHFCHSTYKMCPPCSALTEKMCYNNHMLVSNVSCLDEDVFCSTVCNKPLPCGHTCSRFCHAGNCLDYQHPSCRKICDRKLSCNHTCSLQCHPNTPCKQTPCQKYVIVKCFCNFRRYRLYCSEIQELRRFLLDKGIPMVQDEFIYSFLPCNDICAIKTRNSNLARSLGIGLEKDPYYSESEPELILFGALIALLKRES